MNKYNFTFFLYILFFSIKSFAIDTKAEQAIVVDFDTNEILFEKNYDLKTPPASMTKIMTVYAAFDRIKKPSKYNLSHLHAVAYEKIPQEKVQGSMLS